MRGRETYRGNGPGGAASHTKADPGLTTRPWWTQVHGNYQGAETVIKGLSPPTCPGVCILGLKQAAWKLPRCCNLASFQEIVLQGTTQRQQSFISSVASSLHLCSTFQNSVAFTEHLIRALPILSCGKGRSLSSSCGISGPVLCRRHEVTGSRSQAGDWRCQGWNPGFGLLSPTSYSQRF